ncbi:MAG: VPLPA-CTERM sorting domain-containing protein [Gammaproteobacteria bacterium]
MKGNISTAAAAVALALAAGQASAHVGYGSALYSGDGVYDPLANTVGTGTLGAASNFNASVSSNAGYITGLDPNTLGNTHDIRFRYFTLSSQSLVSFTIVGNPNNPVSGNPNAYLNGLTASRLNPAFSLYSGVVPASSHDGYGDIATVAAYDVDVSGEGSVADALASAPQFAAWSPFAPVNDVRGGAAAGTPDNDTGLWGVFDSDGDWGIANNGQFTATNTAFGNPAPADGSGPYLGNVGTPKYAMVTYLGISGADAEAGATFVDSLGVEQALLGADGNADYTVSWSGILGPGIYTLAIGGANIEDYDNLFTDVRSSSGGLDAGAVCGATTCANLYAADRLSRSLSITEFSVAPVPVPAAVWLFGSALAGVAGLRRRRC